MAAIGDVVGSSYRERERMRDGKKLSCQNPEGVCLYSDISLSYPLPLSFFVVYMRLQTPKINNK